MPYSCMPSSMYLQAIYSLTLCNEKLFHLTYDVCVCMCAHAVFLGEWVVLGCYLHANAKASHLSPIHANWFR